ncbi:MAG: hypothetical protein IPH16_08185 [Haliscomenobacter sp.]|nr:hypothetical protein [Haliscomenobacter sp.]MBK7475918.1 hypothetical protein [Haliscomenobacter sp.]MBK8879546.1 hypothetical protein [Haliscomenobacter sp.]
MKSLFLFFFLAVSAAIYAQSASTAIKPKPSYCNEPPEAYDSRKNASAVKPAALPKFNSKPVMEYRVQVAILRKTDPTKYPFHRSLVARYQPCEEVWIVESKQSFRNRQDAEKLRAELAKMGYGGAYITTLVGYE